MNDNVTILLVDDLEENLFAMAALLRGPGLRLLKARSGEAALELLLVNEVALALVDVQMPDMDGFELAELMRGSERTRHVPIVFVTAGAHDRKRLFQGYDSGAVDFLYKPIEPHILTNKVAVFVELFRQKEALVAAKNEISQHATHLERMVTERTSQLRETISELQAFSYSISHDMRAPLRAMQGYSSYLVEEYSDKLDAQGVDYLQQIMRSSVRLDSLIRDVLTYTKILHSQIPIERVDLDLLMRDIVETYSNGQPTKTLTIINGTLPAVLGNVALLTQCISNLLNNGTKFVLPGTKPRMEIWAEAREETSIRLWFKDNGIGIASENHKRIFKMFERIHSETKYEGTGIGLTIVRKATERMGAQVGFESELGKGSSFWIDLTRG